MKQIAFIALLATALFSCEQKPFINHKLSFKKFSADCSQTVPDVKMESNTNGERFTFNKCLGEGFDGKAYSVERKGDTVIVNFNESPSADKQAAFAITLDLDANPKYNFILLDNELMQVAAQ